jgi:CubicO group peptidase (beta-lactamase class C family)
VSLVNGAGIRDTNPTMRHRLIALILALLGVTLVLDAQRSSAPTNAPASSLLDLARMARADEVIRQAIGEKLLPGAVLLVGRGDEIVYEKAYGNRATVPSVEPMTTDTIFDMASVTKVVATTTSVMILIEEGRIRLTDRVASFIPEFGKYGKNEITVRHLLTHVSGLRPDIDLNEEFRGYGSAIERACEEVPVAAPGERFVYSDIGFFSATS